MTTVAEEVKFIPLFRPGFAWFVASLASGAALTVNFAVLSLIEGNWSNGDALGFALSFIPASLFFAGYTACFSAIPALAAAWLMHAMGWRSVWISAVLGGVVGAALIQVLLGFPLHHGMSDYYITALFGTAGLVGGAVYRLVAGKG